MIAVFVVYNQASYVPVYPGHETDSYVKIIQKPLGVYPAPLELTDDYGHGYGYKGDHNVSMNILEYHFHKGNSYLHHYQI